jgi:hypothetical protein
MEDFLILSLYIFFVFGFGETKYSRTRSTKRTKEQKEPSLFNYAEERDQYEKLQKDKKILKYYIKKRIIKNKNKRKFLQV